MRTDRVLAFLCLCLLSTTALDAQALREGALVRLHRQEPPPVTGRVSRLSPDTLWVRIDHAMRPVPLRSVVRAELRERLGRTESGWRWARRGFLVGATLGAVTCLADPENCKAETGTRDSLSEGLLGAATFLGGGVAFLGFIGGTAVPGHRWVEIPIPLEDVRR